MKSFVSFNSIWDINWISSTCQNYRWLDMSQKCLSTWEFTSKEGIASYCILWSQNILFFFQFEEASGLSLCKLVPNGEVDLQSMARFIYDLDRTVYSTCPSHSFYTGPSWWVQIKSALKNSFSTKIRQARTHELELEQRQHFRKPSMQKQIQSTSGSLFTFQPSELGHLEAFSFNGLRLEVKRWVTCVQIRYIFQKEGTKFCMHPHFP